MAKLMLRTRQKYSICDESDRYGTWCFHEIGIKNYKRNTLWRKEIFTRLCYFIQTVLNIFTNDHNFKSFLSNSTLLTKTT